MGFNESTTMDDVLENPTRYGVPTPEEFRKNPEKWLGREDEKFALCDKGSSLLSRVVKRHVFEIEGYRCKTLEEVEKVALGQGIPLKDLDYEPELIPCGAGKYDVVVKFVSKKERQKREAWNE